MHDPAICGSLRANRVRLLYLAFAVQALGALFFVGDLWSDILGLRSEPIPWMWQEYIQVLASAGLIVGVLVSGIFLRLSLRRISRMGRQIEVVSGNFQTHLLALFEEWNFSPSEQAVAIYAMKGFTNNEIAVLRGTTTATIKSQMNSVFRKSGLSSRQQLGSFLVEELLAGLPMNDRSPSPIELKSLPSEAA
ncbi:helix-turn-helix transcriptional regulator [Mesorhizobium sp. 10J20-29]